MNTKERIPAEVFPPGDYIQEELDARGWNHGHLAVHIGISADDAAELIAGRAALTPEIAMLLGGLFGASPQMWLNLEATWQKRRCRQ